MVNFQEHAQIVFQREFAAGSTRRRLITSTHLSEPRARGELALPVEIAVLNGTADSYHMLVRMTVEDTRTEDLGDLFASLYGYAHQSNATFISQIFEDALSQPRLTRPTVIYYLLRNGFFEAANQLSDRFQAESRLSEEALVDQIIAALDHLAENGRTEDITTFFRENFERILEEGSESYRRAVDRLITDVLLRQVERQAQEGHVNPEDVTFALLGQLALYLSEPQIHMAMNLAEAAGQMNVSEYLSQLLVTSGPSTPQLKGQLK